MLKMYFFLNKITRNHYQKQIVFLKKKERERARAGGYNIRLNIIKF